ncbi:dihydrolipoyllysine-residue acetyltransferase [Thioalbus denitrificans]|uniref:Acetyltransferase component of pyruvate dehydrogenase complex n=1 Tax=Thioalbus denitrificans TaxID=547122 RepID=A0A369CK74_9GAMM|nr:pyruvate dehydrogenase E2 component (dihydrolipoamide acetyltransferase) [Thioalbus denitrificans]
MGTQKDVLIPDIGDFADVDVIEVVVAPGDRVDVDDPLLTLESDKASMDIPAPFAGVVKEVKVKVGDKVSEGDVAFVIEAETAGAQVPAVESAQAAVPAPEPKAVPAPETRAAPPPAQAAAESMAETPASPWQPPPVPAYPAMSEVATGQVHASPSVRRFARELGADLAKVTGTGPKGRILKEDVQGFVKYELSRPKATPAGGSGFSLPEMPEVDFSRFGEIETQPLSRIRKISGANLQRNWITVPHVTQHDEADITDMEAFRKAQGEIAAREGVRLTPLVFLMKACVAALKAYPDVNSSLAPDGENLILKKYFHIGVAVDTPNGLVVPVIRDVDRKGLMALARELGDVSAKAREGKLGPADMQGGCFTISSLGGIGGTQFTPIVNAPEVAILGVSRAEMKPIYDGQGGFVPRLMLPLSLSYDHRVIDGAAAARFTTYLRRLLGDIRTLLL